jgi:hypothetical protein
MRGDNSVPVVVTPAAALFTKTMLVCVNPANRRRTTTPFSAMCCMSIIKFSTSWHEACSHSSRPDQRNEASQVSYRTLSPEGFDASLPTFWRFPNLPTLTVGSNTGSLLPPNSYQIAGREIPPATRFPRRVVPSFFQRSKIRDQKSEVGSEILRAGITAAHPHSYRASWPGRALLMPKLC